MALGGHLDAAILRGVDQEPTRDHHNRQAAVGAVRLVAFILVLSMLVALDLAITVSGSLYAVRSDAVLVVLFFAVMAVAVWKRWDWAFSALQNLAISGLLLRGVVMTEGVVLPSLLRSFVLLAVVNGLVYAATWLRPPA